LRIKFSDIVRDHAPDAVDLDLDRDREEVWLFRVTDLDLDPDLDLVLDRERDLERGGDWSSLLLVVVM
jgi:hypothetical protein